MLHRRTASRLALEVAALDGDAAAPRAPAARGRPGAEVILVVDDDPDMRAYYADCLAGYRVLEAADGAEALAVLRAAPVRLVVSDVVMPRMGGLALCRAMQRDAQLAGVPVVLVTGEAGSEMDPRARAAGAQAFLAKPFNAAGLGALVARVLGGRAPP